MFVRLVLMADESGFFASFDVCWEVIDVAGFFRGESVLFDGELVDFRLGFDVACLVGIDASCKFFENGVSFAQKFDVGVAYV